MKRGAIIVGLAVVALLVIGSITMTGYATSLVSMTSKCSDSDGGIDYSVKGEVTYSFRGEEKVLTDECFEEASRWWRSGEGYIREYSCGDKKVLATGHKCENGCLDGICLEA